MILGAQGLGPCPLGSGCRVTDFAEWIVQHDPVKAYAVTGSHTIVQGTYIVQSTPAKAYTAVGEHTLLVTGWEDLECAIDNWSPIGNCND